MPEKLITIRDVCDRYGLSDKTIRRKIKSGQLPAYRVGDRLLKLDPAQVEQALVRRANNNDFESYIEKVLSAAPRLTADQADRLRVLLEPARREINAQMGGKTA